MIIMFITISENGSKEFHPFIRLIKIIITLVRVVLIAFSSNTVYVLFKYRFPISLFIFLSVSSVISRQCRSENTSCHPF